MSQPLPDPSVVTPVSSNRRHNRRVKSGSRAAHFNRPTCVLPPSEFLGRRQEGDAAGEEPDRGPEEPDEANPEGGQPALGEEGSLLG